MVHNFQFLESKANLQSHLQSNLRAKIYPGFFKEIFSLKKRFSLLCSTVSLILYYIYFVQTTKIAGFKKLFLGIPGSLVIRTPLQGAQVQSPVEELRFCTSCVIQPKKNPLLYQVSIKQSNSFQRHSHSAFHTYISLA